MANAQRLVELVVSSGKSKTYLANKTGVSRPYFYKILKHPELCTCGQAENLSKELDIRKQADKDDIFLPSL